MSQSADRTPSAARIRRWWGPFGFFLTHPGNRTVILRIGRLDVLTWWGRS